MAAEGRNLLEVVLNTDIAKKFNEVDKAVDTIQESMKSAAESAKQFADALEDINKSFGDKSGFASFAENIQKLIESLNSLNTNAGAKGIEQTTKGIESIGEAAILDIDSVQKLIDAINKLPEAFSKTSGGTSGRSGGSKKKALDNLLFSRDDIEEKKRELESELERLSSAMMKIKSRISEVSKPKIEEMKFGIESQANKEIEAIRVKMQQLWQDMSVAMQKSGENSKDALVPYLQTVEKLRGEISEIQKNAATMKDMVSARDVTDQSVIELLKQYDAVLAKIHQVAEERRNLIQEQNSTAAQSKQDSEYKKRIEGIISSIKDLQKQYDELKKKNKVFDNEGNMTLEAERIANQISAQKELLKIEQMSAEEAVKYTENKVNAQIKKEQEAFSEIKRLYSEMLGYEKKQAEVEIKGTQKEIQGKDFGEETKLAEIYQKEIDRTRKSIDELAAKYPELAEEAKKAYDTERIKAQIASSEKLDNAIDKTIKSVESLAEAERKQREAERDKKIGLVGGDAPRTIREYEIAIKNLRNEIKNLDADTQKGQINEYNKKIAEYKKKVDEATGATNRFRQENIKLNNVLQQVAGAFGVYLGVQGIVNFARNVATTTGEFELQHRALQAITGDIDQANKLWDKTVRLAVRSPFSVKELVTYTKQLAAYRVETEKLYDTTKMLADISSGLGVDMQRLILAYGQVKAANYLRGQELRQFSEAGINILGELAKYFEEIKGQAVSTGEVFEMVSKRMVKFEDVAEVLKRLMQEGGTFFNMQEIQAETLQGMMMNLKDSFDLMKNEIGEKNKGWIVSLVRFAKDLADNWQKVGNTLSWVVGIFIAFKTAIAAGNIMLAAQKANAIGASIQMTKLTAVMALFNKEVRKAAGLTGFFSKTLKTMGAAGWAGGIISAAFAVTGVVAALVGHYRRLHEAEKNLQNINIEYAATTTKMVESYKEMASKIRDVNTSEDERVELMKKLKRMYGDILPEQLLNIEYIKKEGNSYGEATKAIAAYYQEKRRQRSIEAVEEEYGKKMETAQSNAANSLQKQIENTYGLKVSLLDINQVLSKLNDEIENGTTSAVKYRERLSELMKMQIGTPIDFSLSHLDDMGNKIFDIELGKVDKFIKRAKEYRDNLEETTIDKRFGESLIQDVEKRMEGVNSILRNFTKEIDNSGADIITKAEKISDETIKKFTAMWEVFKGSDAYKKNPDFYENYFEIHIKPIIETAEFDKQESAIKKKVADLIKEYNVTNTEGMSNALFDSSKHTLSEWYKEVLHPMVEMIESTLRLADAGMATESDEVIARYRMQIGLLKEEDEWIKKILDGEKEKGGKSNPALDLLNKQIDAIKNAAKQYDEYKKMYDDTTAFNKTKTEVSGLFKELNIGHILEKGGAFDENVIKDNLEKWLASSIAAAGKGGRQVAQKYISGLQLEFEKEEYAKNIVEKFKENLDDAFDELSLAEELSKLGIGRDFAKTLFGIDTQSTEEIRKFVENWKSQLQGKGEYGETAEKEYKSAIEKIDDMEDKAQKERLKKYIDYTKQAMTERAKIEVEGLRELADIEKAFQIEIAKAQSAGDTARENQLKGIMETAIEGSKKATEEKLGKQAWEDFKGSELYIEMFDDLGNVTTKVIETIQEKIQQLKESYKGLNPTDLKSITQEINKLEDELIKRNPFKGFIDSWKKVKELQKEGKTEERLSERLIGNQEDIEMYENLIVVNEKLLEVRSKWSQEQIDEKGGTAAFLAQNNLLQSQINKWKQLIQQKKKDSTITSADLETYEQFQKAAKSYADYLQNMGSRVAAVFSDIMNNLEAFGGTTTETTKAWGDMGEAIMSIAAMIPGYILLMEAAGVAAKTAFGPIGWIMMAVEALVAIIKGIANLRNAAIDDEIERYKEQVDKLSDKYDRLEKKFDSVWDIDKLRAYNTEMKRNMEQQIGYYEKMIKAEQSRKSPDQSAIDEYNKQINDLYDQMEDRHNEWLEKVSGFGGESSWGDATQGFIDAWYDAFAETGDGLEGLRENFNEIIENMVKKQAALRLANAILEPLYKKINEAADNGTITNAEMDAIVAEANATFPELNEKLKAFFQSLGVFGEQAKGELDGLQKGIQGVTEQTAEIIAAYMNAIRYYVIDNNTKLGQIISALQDSTGTFNPMVAELRNIRQQAEDIRDLLFSWRETGGVPSMRVTIV